MTGIDTLKGETELPYQEVRTLFARTAMGLGLREDFARVLGQSVWYLSNRGYPGVANTIVFLMLNEEVLRKVWGHPDYPMHQDQLAYVCPIRATIVVSGAIADARDAGDLDTFECTIGRSALPMLSLPFIAHDLKGMDLGFDAIELSGPTATMTLSDAGLAEEAQTLSHEFAWVGTRDDVTKPVRYRLARSDQAGDALFYPKRRLSTLKVPTARLNGNGTLRLG